MNTFNIIYDNITLSWPIEATILALLYCENLFKRAQIEMIHRFLLRAIRRKQQKQVLTYAYYLGQLIESDPMIARRARALYLHYYKMLIRTYYIFETCPEQIARTKVTTLNMIQRLKSSEFASLVSKV